jgi:hypothetical protein
VGSRGASSPGAGCGRPFGALRGKAKMKKQQTENFPIIKLKWLDRNECENTNATKERLLIPSTTENQQKAKNISACNWLEFFVRIKPGVRSNKERTTQESKILLL